MYRESCNIVSCMKHAQYFDQGESCIDSFSVVTGLIAGACFKTVKQDGCFTFQTSVHGQTQQLQ